MSRSSRCAAVVSLVAMVTFAAADPFPAEPPRSVHSEHTTASPRTAGEAPEVPASVRAVAAVLHAAGRDVADPHTTEGRGLARPLQRSTHAGASISVGDDAFPVRIELPTGSAGRTPEVTGDLSSYAGVVPQTDVVTRPVGAAGTQVFTVLHGPLAPASFRYDLDLPPGTALVPSADGGADVVDRNGATVGSIAPAWAVDAGGHRLRTSYRVLDDVLTQVVHHRGWAAYPVVADPAYQRNCGIVTCTWYLSVAKTKEVAKQLSVLPVNVAINLNVGAACAVAGVAGGPVGGVLCTIITAVGVAHAQSVFGAAARSNDCVRLATGARAPIGRVSLSNRFCARS